jgi:soluble lytic murein transglycosylase-like protein
MSLVITAHYRQRVVPCALAFAWLCIVATPASAEVWAFIDDHGKRHVATQKIDDRYQLFFKGKSSADLIVPEVAPDDTADDDAFRLSSIYRRIANQPNVQRFEPLIALHAKQHDIDPALLKAVIAVESAFDPGAISSKGAVGLMQVIPETAQRYGVVDDSKRSTAQKLLDPAINVRTGTRYLRDLLAMFSNDIVLALAAYNAGEYAVQRYNNAVPPFPETQEFVKLVQQFHAVYRPPPPVMPPAAPLPTRITIPSRRSAP